MRKSIISFALALGLAVPGFAAGLQLKADAPSRYTVKRGDTLWSISGRYLNSPWKWPRLWRMNQGEIKNPHWIYPGDVLALDYVDGQPRLSLARGAQREVKLSPQARVEMLDQAVASIPASAIEPFLKRPLVVDMTQFLQSPKLIAGPEDHLTLATGDRVYATGVNEAGTWQAYRLGKPLLDPDTKKVLGVEATYSGDLTADKPQGEVQTLKVRSVSEEILVGDHLMRAPLQSFNNYAPHPADSHLSGKVVSVYNGVDGAAQYSTIVLNLGQSQGVENGHVFGLFKKGRPLEIKDEQGKRTVTLPAERSGNAFVYRVFDKVSYALVLDSRGPIYVGDGVASPEQE
ncbi:LysM peptidoglycan-binding domain-containing protein [Chromobacterium haemolyticum]|uniref:LysM peptidoglycan-binding domain-containing protein n=1 Tax=Chromobacterium haemolyticum TaxID=394935 RepID=UPI0005BCACED|nr:LysM peptidoglycan-binding domain-containing protein [Chromobacterium haemolyticum]